MTPLELWSFIGLLVAVWLFGAVVGSSVPWLMEGAHLIHNLQLH
jgi:hypothetical protein